MKWKVYSTRQDKQQFFYDVVDGKIDLGSTVVKIVGLKDENSADCYIEDMFKESLETMNYLVETESIFIFVAL